MHRSLLLSLVVFCVSVNSETAYVEVSWTSVVGVNINDVPVFDRERVADTVLRQSEEYWKDAAIRQSQLTRSHFIYYRHPLTTSLPTKDLWRIKFNDVAKRRTIGKFDYVAREFAFYTVIIGEGTTIKDPQWAIGESRTDVYNLPVDPEGILSKTGYACSAEIDGGVKDLDAEAMHWFYNDFQDLDYLDDNQYYFPEMTCAEALDAYIGRSEILIFSQQVDLSKATQAKKDDLNTFMSAIDFKAATADIIPVDLNAQTWVEWKYFGSKHCALNKMSDNCIGATGWRKLLRFGAGGINVGKTELEIGDVNTALQGTNMDVWDECHQHKHLIEYMNTTYSLATNNLPKRSFCMISSYKYINRPGVGFHNYYGACDGLQGVEPGWGDEYPAHYDCQWVDVTDAGCGNGELMIHLDAAELLCEGVAHRDGEGRFVLEETPFMNSGKKVYRPKCKRTDGAYDNNKMTVSLVNSALYDASTLAPCPYPQYSIYRDCGLAVQEDMLTCKPGKLVQLKLYNPPQYPSQIVRICESSAQLGHSTYCDATWSLVNIPLGPGEERRVFFRCPEKREEGEPGGFYSILTGGVLESDGYRPVKFETCAASTTAVPSMPYRHIQEDFDTLKKPALPCQSQGSLP